MRIVSTRPLLATLCGLAVGTVLLSSTAMAQDNNGAGNTATTTTTDDSPDYGWVGLLGLAGLAGLLKKPQVVHDVRHDHTTPGTGVR